MCFYHDGNKGKFPKDKKDMRLVKSLHVFFNMDLSIPLEFINLKDKKEI